MEIKAPLPGFLSLRRQLLARLDECQAVQSRRQGLRRHGRSPKFPISTLSQMEGKVEEIDRGRIAVGNEVRVRVDSLPELTMPAKLGQSPCSPKSANRVAAHPQLSRVRSHPPSRPAAASGHERRHGHRDQSHSERDQHSGEGPLHARRQAHRLPGRTKAITAPSKFRCWRAIPTKWRSAEFPPARWSPWSTSDKKDQKK